MQESQIRLARAERQFLEIAQSILQIRNPITLRHIGPELHHLPRAIHCNHTLRPLRQHQCQRPFTRAQIGNDHRGKQAQ